MVVTGLGIISPLGIGVQENWKAVCDGRSGIGPITKFDTTDYDTKIAGEVKNFDPTTFIDKKEARKMDAFIHYALACGMMAKEDARLTIDQNNAERVGVLVGAGLGGLSTIEKYHTILLKDGPKKISPFFIPMLIVNLAPGQIPCAFISSTPGSGTHQSLLHHEARPELSIQSIPLSCRKVVLRTRE